jgi:ATP-dependent RNA helicase DeaD
VTHKQADEIPRIEREAKTVIGEWEPPEERIEHAPRPRRRDHSREDRAPQKREKPAAESGNGHVKLFVNRGARSGISEENLRWALTEGAVIPAEEIGDIRVLERFSFVDLPDAQAKLALERLDGTKLEGKQIRVEYAKD